jgi:hypothetical protein
MLNKVQYRGNPIVARVPKNGSIAEIGVMRGKLSHWLLTTRSDIRLLMVDNWLPPAQRTKSYRRTGDKSALRGPESVERDKLATYRRVSAFPGRCIIMCMDSLVAAAQIPDRSIDLVFLDADHSYKGVVADLKAWAPKVKPGAYIGGHDYKNPDPVADFSGVEIAVHEWADGRDIETDNAYTWFCKL